MRAFYDHFSRHAHGEGLKAHSTHYCPGCGHGVAHCDLADAIDELGIQDLTRARPIQAGLASAASFVAGAAPPTLLAALLPTGMLSGGVVAVTLILLLVLGGVAGRLGGAAWLRGALRVAFWGAVAMGGTAAVGRLFGAAV